MRSSVKPTLFFLMILYLHAHSYCLGDFGGAFGKVGKLFRGSAKVDGTDGTHGIANAQGGAHLDPVHAGGDLNGKAGGLGEGDPLAKNRHMSPVTHIPSAAWAVADTEKAGAITASSSGKLAEGFSKAMDYLAKWAPNLYRRLRTMIFVFKPIKLQDVNAFVLKFQSATPEAQFRTVIDTFHTLTSAKTIHSAEELSNWPKGMGNAMKVTNAEALQSPLVETQMQKELCDLLLVASKQEPNSPFRQSFEDFRDLDKALCDRAGPKREIFKVNPSYEKRIKWGRELMNIDNDLLRDSSTVNNLVDKLLEEKARQPVNKLLEIVQDGTLRNPPKSTTAKVNTYTLDQRTAAIAALQYVYQSSLAFRMGQEGYSQARVMLAWIEHNFGAINDGGDFLYPHWKKMRETIEEQKKLRQVSPS
ncbi:hypothetical protein O181_044903 [Austropuccinia psidii MF-1]|uniref:Uncharacterized protein n=1 Tax=Austropuccinia psidii MF-1 TaxID=1389203 RepID=A0A9Q3DP74_9BASI|nr:hypothetical protein [Austropuccinia psidii MF-1]